MSWEQYFKKNKGRAVRPLYAKAIGFLKYSELDTIDAVDIGCGAGIETSDMLGRGWNVTAIDRELSSIALAVELAKGQLSARLKTICSSFEELTAIPPAEFIFSYHSLPFCQANHIDRIWGLIDQAVKENGIFAGSFFGVNDEWVKSGHTTGTSSEKLASYLANFEILHLEEIDRVGDTALDGPKHWHVIEVIARK